MATVQGQLTNIVRVNLDDEIKSRWSDSQLLTFFKQAVQRIQGVGYRHRLNFMRSKYETTVLAGVTTFATPSDFLTPAGLWRTDQHTEIKQAQLDEWETLYTDYDEFSAYIIEDDIFEIANASESDIPIRLRYYTNVDVNALTLSSQTPWSGKLDYAITEYVQLRALQVDRYNTQSDTALLSDMENLVVLQFQDLDPSISETTGGFV